MKAKTMSDEKKKFPGRGEAKAGKWLRRIGALAAAAALAVVVVVTRKSPRRP